MLALALRLININLHTKFEMYIFHLFQRYDCDPKLNNVHVTPTVPHLGFYHPRVSV